MSFLRFNAQFNAQSIVSESVEKQQVEEQQAILDREQEEYQCQVTYQIFLQPVKFQQCPLKLKQRPDAVECPHIVEKEVAEAIIATTKKCPSGCGEVLGFTEDHKQVKEMVANIAEFLKNHPERITGQYSPGDLKRQYTAASGQTPDPIQAPVQDQRAQNSVNAESSAQAPVQDQSAQRPINVEVPVQAGFFVPVGVALPEQQKERDEVNCYCSCVVM